MKRGGIDRGPGFAFSHRLIPGALTHRSLQERMMVGKKGTLQKIADAVGDAVQAVAVGLGVEPEPDAPKPKAARKAAQKEAIERAEKSKVAARKTARRRAG